VIVTFVGGYFEAGGGVALTFKVREQSLEASISTAPAVVVEAILHVMIIKI
jgi:hypothetical protein